VKIFLIILAVIFILFGILLISSVKLKIYLSKNGYIVIKYLFLRFKYDIYGDNKVKRIKKSKNKKVDSKNKKSSDSSNQKVGYFKKIYNENGWVEGTVQLLSTLKLILSKVAELALKCKISNLVLKIKVVADNPSDTAVYYGGVCSVAYPAIGMLNGIFTIKKQNIDINADYNSEKPEVEFMAIIKLRVFSSVKVAFSLIKEFIQGGL